MKKIGLIFILVICDLVNYAQQSGFFTDTRDGKVYKTVKIINQTWFAENLVFKADSGCWAYDDNERFAAIYGYLYIFPAAKSSCPNGWHLPINSEWEQLINYLGGDAIAGGKLKSKHGWNSPNKGASNSVGFSAFPGGERWYGDTLITSCSGDTLINCQTYDNLGNRSFWWGSYITFRNVASHIGVFYDSARIHWSASNAKACYVRCVKD